MMKCTLLILTMLSCSHGFAFSKKIHIQKRTLTSFVNNNHNNYNNRNDDNNISKSNSNTKLSSSSARRATRTSTTTDSFSSLSKQRSNKNNRNKNHASSLFSSSQGLDSNNDNDVTTTTTTSTDKEQGLMKSIGEKLAKISNIASMLCVIDCTVLPVVTVLLPLIGLGASPAQAKWLHELGHSVAIFFVLPVGGLAATMNYLSSKNAFLSSIAVLGLSMIYAANGHGGPILSRLPHNIAHSLHCGTLLHRSVNIVGCACLLTSNYLAHRLGCDHDHGHGHSHSDSCCDHDHE